MRPEVAVAGYVCLDVIPTFDEQKDTLEPLFQPGKLLGVGTAVNLATLPILGEFVAQSGSIPGYEYDFGDSWHHELLLEKVLTRHFLTNVI